MVKKTSKTAHTRNRRTLYIALSVVLLAILVAIALYIVKSNQPSSQTSEAKSNANVATWVEAKNKKDASICDRISGGIMADNGQSRVLPGGVNVDDFGRPAMTESEAKAQCHKEVQDLINSQNH